MGSEMCIRDRACDQKRDEVSGEWFDFHESVQRLVQQSDTGNVEKQLIFSCTAKS